MQDLRDIYPYKIKQAVHSRVSPEQLKRLRISQNWSGLINL
jgi:hypothetical protein